MVDLAPFRFLVVALTGWLQSRQDAAVAYLVEENRTLRAQLQTPYRAPNANARAERFVRSITTECLVKVIPFGERHFRRTLTDFVAHDHGERSHQGLGNALIDGPTRTQHQGRSRRRRRLGGVLDYDYRAA